MLTPRLAKWIRWVGSMSVWPLELAQNLLQRQASAWRRASAGPALTAVPVGPTLAAQAGPAAALSWPFDLARAQHAASVQSGYCERSLLASAAFERGLDLMERLTLGPFARRV